VTKSKGKAARRVADVSKDQNSGVESGACSARQLLSATARFIIDSSFPQTDCANPAASLRVVRINGHSWFGAGG
jgi:hypothetical protein